MSSNVQRAHGAGDSIALLGGYLVLYALAAILIWVGGLKLLTYEAQATCCSRRPSGSSVIPWWRPDGATARRNARRPRSAQRGFQRSDGRPNGRRHHAGARPFTLTLMAASSMARVRVSTRMATYVGVCGQPVGCPPSCC